MPETTKNLALRQPNTRIDIRETDWFKPLTFSILNDPTPGDLAQSRFDGAFRVVMEEQGHTLIPDARSEPRGERLNLLLTYENVPADRRLIKDRVEEHIPPLALALTVKYSLPERPENLFTVITIPERLSDKSHDFVVNLVRASAAKIGSPRITFLSADRNTGEIYEITNGTLEGGHDTTIVKEGDVVEAVKESRDRMVAVGSTEVVGNKYRVQEEVIEKESYEQMIGPGILIAAGQRMDKLGLLPEPLMVSKYVSPRLAEFYKRFLNMANFSEGMLFVRDPKTGLIMTTASGSWNVDKRHLRRDEVSILTGIDEEGYLQVAGVKGLKAKGPSVEAREMYKLMAKYSNIRAGFHSHVGINDIDENIAEWVRDYENYVHGFCCGTDHNERVTLDAGGRSEVINGLDLSRAIAVWRLRYHGIVAVEIENEITQGLQPFDHLLDAFDPNKTGAVLYDPHHIHQKDLF